MSRNTLYIALSLAVCLFIYLFYRTSHTVVNELLTGLFPARSYEEIKSSVISHLPLSNLVIYSLPEGLWVFCITLTSKPFYLSIGGRKISGAIVPILFAAGLELLQLLHIARGRFDVLDILSSLAFWLLGYYGIRLHGRSQHILRPFNLKSAGCVLSYAIVYLAHVSK